MSVNRKRYEMMPFLIENSKALPSLSLLVKSKMLKEHNLYTFNIYRERFHKAIVSL